MAATKKSQILKRYKDQSVKNEKDFKSGAISEKEFKAEKSKISNRRSSALYNYRLENEKRDVNKIDETNFSNVNTLEVGSPYFKVLSYGHDAMDDDDGLSAVSLFEDAKLFNAGKMRAIIDATEVGGGKSLHVDFFDFQKSMRAQYLKSRKKQGDAKNFTSDFADQVSITRGDIGGTTYLVVRITP